MSTQIQAGHGMVYELEQGWTLEQVKAPRPERVPLRCRLHWHRRVVVARMARSDDDLTMMTINMIAGRLYAGTMTRCARCGLIEEKMRP